MRLLTSILSIALSALVLTGCSSADSEEVTAYVDYITEHVSKVTDSSDVILETGYKLSERKITAPEVSWAIRDNYPALEEEANTIINYDATKIPEELIREHAALIVQLQDLQESIFVINENIRENRSMGEFRSSLLDFVEEQQQVSIAWIELNKKAREL